jgi:hypothetical protein
MRRASTTRKLLLRTRSKRYMPWAPLCAFLRFERERNFPSIVGSRAVGKLERFEVRERERE